jgi:hypothetical protein
MGDRYTLQNGSSVVNGVWWRPVSGRVRLYRALGLFVHEGMIFHPRTDVVLCWDNGVCCHEWRMPLLGRWQTSRENPRQASGQSLPEGGGSEQFKRIFKLPC